MAYHPQNQFDTNGTYDIVWDGPPYMGGFGIVQMEDSILIVGGKYKNSEANQNQATRSDIHRFCLTSLTMDSQFTKMPNPGKLGGPLWVHNIVVKKSSMF